MCQAEPDMCDGLARKRLLSISQGRSNACVSATFGRGRDEELRTLVARRRRAWRRRFGEFRRIHRSIDLYRFVFGNRASINPRFGHAERYLDSGNLSVIGIIELGGNIPNRYCGV